VGPSGVERGYNVLLADLPGMGLNTFHGVYFRPDTEVAVGACIDYLTERSDVDPSRIAFYGGGEPGGWVAVRAAAREPRIAACVADPYVADSDAILAVFRRPDVAALGDGHSTVPGQAQQTARFYEGEPGRGYPKLVAEPEKIRCPLLCLSDPGDNEELRQQAAAAVEAAPNPASRHRVFTPEEGTVVYRQIDNFSLKHRVMFDWLDEVLNADPAGPDTERRLTAETGPPPPPRAGA